MPEYRFTALVTVSAYTVVDAPTEEAAREIAETRRAKLGNDDSWQDVEHFWVIDDADGEPQDIKRSEQ